ncbi:MAG: FtsX-like permease family protein [Acidobacteriota bacterium]|nr:FtsX-like permease family protein [Acidobacteriota bacterium]
MKYAFLVWRNLLRRKTRTIFTVGAILVTFILYGVLAIIRTSFSMGVDVAGADRLMMVHKVSFIQPLPISYENRIAQTEGVEAVTHQTWFGGVYQDPKNFFAQMAVVPDKFIDIYPEYTVPPDQMKAWMSNRQGVIIGPGLVTRFGWKIGDRVPLLGTIWRPKNGNTWEFIVDGIYESKEGIDPSQMFLRYDYLDESRGGDGPAAGIVGWYIIRVNDPASSPAVASTLDEMFANSSFETKTSSEKAFIQGFANQIGNIGAIMTAVTAATLFILLLVVANTMAQSIRERTNELAVLKTLGFPDGLVLGLVLAESLVLAVIGGSIGLLLAWLFAKGGDPTYMLPAFSLPVRDIFIGIGLIALLGILAGLLPALQARRLRIVDALRKN